MAILENQWRQELYRPELLIRHRRPSYVGSEVLLCRPEGLVCQSVNFLHRREDFYFG